MAIPVHDPRMPTLTALRVFEAVARHNSFKQAAAELGVTPAAVSFQIRQLEKDLGVSLFKRHANRISLTEHGTAFFPQLTDGMDLLSAAFRSFLDATHTDCHPVRVASGPAVMSKWLVPNMRDLQTGPHPVTVDFDANLGLSDLVRDEIDFAIRFGRPPDPRYHTTMIVEEYVVPMVAAECAAELACPADLTKFDLIHDMSLHRINPDAPGWSHWLTAMGLDPDRFGPGTAFNQSDHALQAAIDGFGVALARVVLGGPDLERGRLMVPFGPMLPTGLHYYLISPTNQRPGRDKARVKSWILDDIGRRFHGLVSTVSDLTNQSD